MWLQKHLAHCKDRWTPLGEQHFNWQPPHCLLDFQGLQKCGKRSLLWGRFFSCSENSWWKVNPYILFWHRDRVFSARTIDRIINHIILTQNETKKTWLLAWASKPLTHLVRMQISWQGDYCVRVKFRNHSIKKVLTKGSDFSVKIRSDNPAGGW